MFVQKNDIVGITLYKLDGARVSKKYKHEEKWKEKGNNEGAV